MTSARDSQLRVSAKALFLALLLCALVSLGASASAQQFSARLVTINAQGRPDAADGQIYVGGGFVRIEIPDFRNGRFLIDVNARTAIYLVPAQRIFMDAKQSSRLTQILVPVDPNDPCRGWQAMARIAGSADRGEQWRCRRLGSDTVGDLVAIKYQAISPQGRALYAWIDPERKFPVKLRYADGSGVALGDIREGPQPAELFAIPADYRKFDPQQLIEHIKQSDVWVDPPK